VTCQLLVVCQSIAQPAVAQEFGNPSKHIAGVALASQVGLLVGAALWGFSADIIGRRLAFNTSLFICAAFVLIAGAMPNYISFSAMYVATLLSTIASQI
jgi:MFS family permease